MANHNQYIPPDELVSGYNPDDSDDGIEGDYGSNFSLASTTHDFSFEHGRRYPSYRGGNHPFPFDELSVRNERLLHHMLLYLLGDRLYIAPIEQPQSILDVRCALGHWAENMAEKFEDALVVGMDTTPRERTTHPNLVYQVQGFNDEWILDTPGQKFDFIYARLLFGATNNLDDFYRQCFANMEPGGYLEHVEIDTDAKTDDNSAKPGNMVQHLCSLVEKMSKAYGKEYNLTPMIATHMKQAGFVDVQEIRLKCPLGQWPAEPKMKAVGEWLEAFYKSGLQGWMMSVMTNNLGYTPEKVNEMCEEAFTEVDGRDQHFYFETYIVHGRKPE